MSDEIKPALTSDEWKALSWRRDEFGTDVELTDKWGDGWKLMVGGGCYDYSSHGDAGRHAIAALALHQQPYGFTPEDVDLLNTLATEWARDIEEGMHADEDFSRAQLTRLSALADRIAALLPPST